MNMGSGLGDAACHVINVGICCSNWHDSTWADGSVVNRALLQLQEVGCLNLRKKKKILHQIRLNWIPLGVLLDYM